jgi:Protein of unknown function (DUF4232)
VKLLKAARYLVPGAAAAAGLAVLAFAYPSSATAPGAIAWVNRPVAIPAVKAPVNPGLPACATASLSIRLVRRGIVGYGTYAYIYSARNIGPRACYVSGTPRVTVVGKSVTQSVNVLNVSAGTLVPGASATFAIIETARVPCTVKLRNGVTASTAVRAQLRIGPRASRAVSAATLLTTNCVTVHVTPIGLPLTQPNPDSLSGLRVALALPARIAAGHVLRFAVTITNPTRAAVRLSRCPSYELGLSVAPAKAYKLNCSAARVIGSGQSRTYEMQFAIPADAPAGLAKIGWFLLNPNRTGAGSTITITRPASE